jgi:ribonuclease G
VTKELVISANRHETRVAILEDDQVVEVYHQRENEYSLAGSIHKGKVTRVLPGMQSAFVDIGLERDAFLYVSDFFEDNEEYDKIVTSVEEKILKLERTPPPPAAGAAPPAVESEPAPPAGAEEVPAESRPAPVPADSEAAPAPVAAQAPPPVYEQRGDRGPGGHPGDRDRDRRGRRGRRRRGQKGGRGLPDSKFYSPGRAPQTPEVPVEAAPVEEIAAPTEADDFFVLPGESLAKYGNTADAESGADYEEGPESGLPAGEMEEAAELVEEGEMGESVTASAVSAEPPAEPQPELAAAVEEVTHASEAAPAEPVIPEAAGSAAPQMETESAEPEAGAEEIVAQSEEAPVPEGDAAGETAEADADASLETADAEGGEEAEAAEGGEIAQAVEDEGPEPARIPTSLTATLREQGPRYLHRVSRRMRRRGGRDRDGREGREGREGRREAPEAAPAAVAPSGAAEARPEQRTASAPKPEARAEKSGAPSISDLLRQGQEIIVQIAKEPLGQKGARITSHIALPGRFLVYMPTVDHIGVSRKIPSEDERLRLKRILQSSRTGIPGGYIVRTAGEGHSEEELRADMMFLYNLWLDMRQKAERRPAPVLIHHDLSVVERVLRDQLTSAFKSIWVDNEEAYENVLGFVQRFQPALVSRVKLYTRSNPIFEEFGISAELEKALRPKVWLKSGGHIVINQTEALVAIDVNTGKFVGKSNRLEDTIVKTNTDAIKEIVRQIRLRDLGGIIVVDFIDMDERKNRQKVMQALEEAMRADKAPYKILQFNDFGLVAITRKRVKQSLERTLCTPCPYCEGAGYVKSPQTVVGEILQEAQKLAKVIEGKDVMLRVAPDVARLLKSNQNTYLQEIEEILGRTLIVKSDQQLHQEKFDLA